MLEYERTDISEGIDVNKTNYQKSIILVTIGNLRILVLNMHLIFVMDVMI